MLTYLDICHGIRLDLDLGTPMSGPAALETALRDWLEARDIRNAARHETALAARRLRKKPTVDYEDQYEAAKRTWDAAETACLRANDTLDVVAREALP